MRNGFVGDAVVGRSERPWAKEELAAATRCQCLGALVSQKNAPVWDKSRVSLPIDPS